MALLAKHRATIYERLSPVIGDEEAEALLAQFPSRDDEEPITRLYLRAELNKWAGELRGETKDLRTELKGDIAELRTELKGDIAGLRGEMHAMGAELKDEIAGMRTWVMSVCIASVMAASTIVGTLT